MVNDMRITFSNNPIDRLCCWIANKREGWCHFLWNRKHHRIQCRICGEYLDSAETMYSPEEYGWMTLKGTKNKMWVCHECLFHRNFKKFMDIIDKVSEDA